MTPTIEIKLSETFKLCTKKLALKTISLEETQNINRHSNIIVNAIETKRDLMHLFRHLSQHIHDCTLIILTSSQSIQTIINGLKKPNISAVLLSRSTNKTRLHQPSESFKKRIDAFKKEGLKKYSEHKETYFKELFDHFPECNISTISRHSTIPIHIIRYKLEKLIYLMIQSNHHLL